MHMHDVWASLYQSHDHGRRKADGSEDGGSVEVEVEVVVVRWRRATRTMGCVCVLLVVVGLQGELGCQ